jgi:hypothetical protein
MGQGEGRQEGDPYRTRVFFFKISSLTRVDSFGYPWDGAMVPL